MVGGSTSAAKEGEEEVEEAKICKGSLDRYCKSVDKRGSAVSCSRPESRFLYKKTSCKYGKEEVDDDDEEEGVCAFPPLGVEVFRSCDVPMTAVRHSSSCFKIAACTKIRNKFKAPAAARALDTRAMRCVKSDKLPLVLPPVVSVLGFVSGSGTIRKSCTNRVTCMVNAARFEDRGACCTRL